MHTKNILHGQNSPTSSSISEDALLFLNHHLLKIIQLCKMTHLLHVEYHLLKAQENQSTKSFYMQTKNRKSNTKT